MFFSLYADSGGFLWSVDSEGFLDDADSGGFPWYTDSEGFSWYADTGGFPWYADSMLIQRGFPGMLI